MKFDVTKPNIDCYNKIGYMESLNSCTNYIIICCFFKCVIEIYECFTVNNKNFTNLTIKLVIWKA